MIVMSPSLWQDVPYGDSDAWQDFLGVHSIQHGQLDKKILALKPGFALKRYPLGDGGEGDWLFANQQQHVSECLALGIAGPPDLQSYDLKDKTQFLAWNQLHAQEHKRMNTAAGLV